MTEARRLAVTVHDVEPATFARCALVRDWLDDHGIDRVTLLVVPAPDLHPFDERRPELAAWLAERRGGGDAIAQLGLHQAPFAGLDARETRRAVDAGRRVLKLAGLEPQGFVAPAYAYTPALRETLRERFTWWAGLLRLHGAAGQDRLAPAWAVHRAPLLLRAGAACAGETLRLDVHPGDLDHPRRMLALEGILRRARRRAPVTLDELALA